MATTMQSSTPEIRTLGDLLKELGRVAADLAGEVLSPSNTRAEIARKRREYFAAGTRLAWIVDPKTRTVEVYTSAEKPDVILSEDGTLTGGDVLPGFTLELRGVFAELDE